jgi:BCD family chlorophyll transporter-like MFS transporter
MATTKTQLEMSVATQPGEAEMTRPFAVGRILRLSTFQIGSAMTDILTAGVWNRIMISDLGIPAWPVGLLLALKYFLAPVSLWIGNRSDNLPLLGWHRTSYIWLGRSLLLLSLPLLGAGTVMLEQDTRNPVGWLVVILCFSLYSIGIVSSGSPYLALVRDSAPESKQGVAIGIVETVLISMFPIAAIAFSRMLVTYDPALFWRLLLFVMAVAGFFWAFSVAGAEKANRRWLAVRQVSERVDLDKTFRMIWGDGRTRGFFLLLFVATFSAWIQDNVLEPFGAEVFGLEMEGTTRLTSYWGTATVIVLVSSLIIWRERRPEDQKKPSRTGLLIMAAGMGMLTGSALMVSTTIFYSGLIVFGAGFGLYTFGGLSLMVAMSPDPHSGAYLGLWTIAILVSKGLGTLMGGVIRDVMLAFGVTAEVAYGTIYAFSAMGLIIAAVLVSGIDVIGFVRDSENQMK